MAAQQGNTELVQLLLEHSARLDVTSPGSTTTPIWIAAQNGHAPTLARLLEGAQRASLLTPLIDATNRQSKTPANIAIELGHADVIGVLARCGADLRRASPAFYGLRDSEAQRVDHFTVTPSSPGHFALDAAARSFAAKQCCHCGAPVPGCSRCSRCALAYYCGRECQLANWPSHKGVCPKLRRGASLVSPDVIPAVAEPPWASLPPFGFDEPFGAADEASDIHHSQYSRDTSAVWEYDAGGARSQPEWRRYPARIEGALESMCMGVPEGEKFMYRPNHPDTDGMYEAHNRSGQPPPGVATRFVIFADMTEREVYTGASRAVRRNGRRANPAEDDGENGVQYST